MPKGKGVKLVPKLRTEAAEWEFIQDRVKQGERLILCYFAVSIIAPKGMGEPCERTLKALYKACGWDLIDETHIQLPAFMSHFPLMLADGLDADYKRMKRLKTMRSANVAAIAPIQGDIVSKIPAPYVHWQARPASILVAFPEQFRKPQCSNRRQVSIGKSVLLQDLTASFAGVGAKTIVIDDGRSFSTYGKGVRRSWISPSSNCPRAFLSTPFG